MNKEEFDIQFDILIKRFCFRNGRHGETYLLEKGLRGNLKEEIWKLFLMLEGGDK